MVQPQLANLTMILTHNGRSLFARRPSTYAEALGSAALHFHIDPSHLVLQSQLGSSSRWVEVTEDAWNTPLLARDEREFRVVKGEPSLLQPSAIAGGVKRRREDDVAASAPAKVARCPDSPLPALASPLSTTAPTSTKIRLTVKFVTGREDIMIKLKSTTPFKKIYQAIAQLTGQSADMLILYWDGGKLDPDLTPQYMEFEEDESIECRARAIGGKPVIYLFPPSALPSVQVDLTLVPEWTFSALYPLAEITRGKGGNSTTSWTVSASPDGTLVDKVSSLSLSYLFWEAQAPLLPPSPPLIAHDAVTTVNSTAFNPGRPLLDRSNAVLLPFAAFLSHLDAALTSLTLHISARNDVITYWLPRFIRIHERGQQIAFRFLEQASYGKSAELKVEPKPDVVTRVFLLFKGVREEDSAGWRKVDEVDWVEEVAVKSAEAQDEKLFRVLEWGGMEVMA